LEFKNYYSHSIETVSSALKDFRYLKYFLDMLAAEDVPETILKG